MALRCLTEYSVCAWLLLVLTSGGHYGGRSWITNPLMCELSGNDHDVCNHITESNNILGNPTGFSLLCLIR